ALAMFCMGGDGKPTSKPGEALRVVEPARLRMVSLINSFGAPRVSGGSSALSFDRFLGRPRNAIVSLLSTPNVQFDNLHEFANARFP
ncbi:MAG: hypothetical protein ACI87O_000241, partial [Planctomycetota bacterium]